MSLPESELNQEFQFNIPESLVSRKDEVLTQNDLLHLIHALHNCPFEEVEFIARIVFQLSPGDVENVKSDSSRQRFNMIDGIVRKWFENSQENATFDALTSLLDENKMLQVKQLWWSAYFDENAKDRQRSYLNERKKLVNEVCRLPVLPEISSSWNDLLRKLNIDHKLHEAMEKYPLDAKLQRLFLLDWWTYRNGYNEASNQCLRQELLILKTCIRAPEGDRADASGAGSSSDANSSARPKTYHFGLFYDSSDQAIAERIKSTLETNEYSVCCFYGHPSQAGGVKSSKASPFSDDCVCVLWVATPNSCECYGYTKEYRDVLNHLSIDKEEERGVKNFIVLIPHEHKGKKLNMPEHLNAYDPLTEDKNFLKRVKVTYNRIEKKYKSKGFSTPLFSNRDDEQSLLTEIL